MIAHLSIYFTYIIEQLGYLGASFLMALESMIAPVPSELVMPFVGFLAAEGKFSIPAAIIFTSLGSIVGSLISYFLGLWGGRPLVIKAGRYLFLNHEHLEWTERWFDKHGSWTIFISRFIPVVRHLISIPAGLGRMNLAHFCMFTIAGATLWNSFLLFAGYKLRQNWTLVEKYSHEVDIAVLFIAVLAIGAWFVAKRFRRNMVANGKAGDSL
ncbi:MAG: DedA family protein [Desulfomonilaceae bacterium]